MTRFLRNNKYLILCILLIMFGFSVGFGGEQAEATKLRIPEIVKLQRRVRTSAEDRRAYETYEKRNAEITPWNQEALPPNPDNAALLYYQAFLLRPEPNMAINDKIHDIFFDAEPDRQIKTYLGYCLPMIKMAEIASQIPQCAWGIWNGPGPEFSEKDLRSQVNYLWTVLLLDARTLASEGHYRAALERCLTVRRLAKHLGEDIRLHLSVRNPDFMALRTIQHVLGIMPPDIDTLTWFRGELTVSNGLPLSFAKMLRADVSVGMNHLRTYAPSLRYLKKVFTDMAENEQAKDKVRSLTDEQFLSRINEELTHFVDSILRVLDSEMTFEQKRAQMQALIDKQMKANGTNSVIKAIFLSGISLGIDRIDRQYPFLVGHQAHINGIKAAVEVYLVLAKTGKLPEKLPDYLPKDPFTGRDFVYEITDEGFALRCQDEEFLKRKNQFLEFKVQK